MTSASVPGMMRLINVDTFRLDEFVDDAVPPYAILSHRWGPDADEVSFRDIESGAMERPSTQPFKFAGAYRQAKLDELQYV